jgi:quercetin dioxygenase-like cupin family protein
MPPTLVLVLGFLAAALGAANTSGLPAAPAPVVPESLSWISPPGNEALRAAWVLGGEKVAAPYVLRVRLAQGGRIPVHTHPDVRNSTVLSGTLWVGFGESADETKMVAVPAGAVYVAPAGVPHYLWARDGDVLYQEGGVGPTANISGVAGVARAVGISETASATGVASSAAGLREVGRFEGLWKKCYEPGLGGVSEIDSGFLVLMPDLRFYELGASCCYEPPDPQPPFWSLGPYRLAGDTVLLEARRLDGSRYEIPLKYRSGAQAVFFDAPRSPPAEVEALLSGDDLNYAWCRLYPAPKR